jgi:oxygen-dependent protoporphyrinogen oxidase
VTHDVLIAGAGVTGLSTAYFLTTLAARPLRLIVVEAEDRPGGVIRTERTQGFIIDQGPDSFVTQRPEGKALCEALGLAGDLIPTEPAARRVYVRIRGKLRAMPEGMVLGLPVSVRSFLRSDFLSWQGKLRMAMDLVLPRGDGREETIAAFIRRRFGEEAVAVIAEPLLAGIHSGRADELSMSATFPQLCALERQHRSIIRGLRTLGRGHAPPFLTLRAGMGSLVDALWERVPAEARALGRRVCKLARVTGGWSLALDDGSALSAPVVVLAIRSHDAALLVEGVAPDLAQALSEITYASSAVVFLAFDRAQVEHPLDGSGFVGRPGEGRIAAGTFVSSKFAGRAPAGKVLLRAFVGGAHDEEALRAPDAAILAEVRRELGALLGISGEPILGRVCRYVRGTPQLRLGHADRVARLRTLEAGLPGLFVAGGAYEGVGIPECARQGESVAERATAILAA